MAHKAGLVGSECGLYMDADVSVQRGDVVRSSGDSDYLVLAAHQVRGMYYPLRWRLRCLRITPAKADEEVEAGAYLHLLQWYSRNARPGSPRAAHHGLRYGE